MDMNMKKIQKIQRIAKPLKEKKPKYIKQERKPQSEINFEELLKIEEEKIENHKKR